MKSALLFNFLKEHLSDQELSWLKSKQIAPSKEIALAFVLASRKIEKSTISSIQLWKSFDTSWNLDHLTKDAIARAYLLCLLAENSSDKKEYLKWMNDLFETAEVNEAIALIQFLSLSSIPEDLLSRAKDAVRSNVGSIFDAIAFFNPYPFHYFEEAAWNQLILKCIFNDKPIHLIIGLNERRNQALADTLSDFAHERWAAGRRVPSQVWRLVSPFMNETLANDVAKLIASSDERDQLAACLVIQEANHSSLDSLSQLNTLLLEKYNSFTWATLENNEPIYTGQ